MKNKILLFNRWDTSGVVFKDKGVECVTNLKPIIVPRTDGKHRSRPRDINIVERFMNKLMVPGHKGKKHKITSGCCTGRTQTLYNAIKNAFIEIEKRTKKNPIQIFINAVENSAVLEEVAAYRLGGIIARKAVSVSPQRRVDIALRHLAQGIYKINCQKPGKTPLYKIIADEIIKAANNDVKSFAISEKTRIEKEAEGAR